jgi:hypothetical protein
MYVTWLLTAGAAITWGALHPRVLICGALAAIYTIAYYRVWHDK